MNIEQSFGDMAWLIHPQAEAGGGKEKTNP